MAEANLSQVTISKTKTNTSNEITLFPAMSLPFIIQFFFYNYKFEFIIWFQGKKLFIVYDVLRLLICFSHEMFNIHVSGLYYFRSMCVCVIFLSFVSLNSPLNLRQWLSLE